MGRLHSNGKGISASAIPYSRTPPAWLKTTPEQVVDQICKLAKKGATPSQIGVVLRDSHGIAQVKVVTGRSSPSIRPRSIVIANISCQVTRFCAFWSPMVRISMSRMPVWFFASSNLFRTCPCLVLDWQGDFYNHRPRTRNTRGPLHVDQEGSFARDRLKQSIW